MEQRAYHPWCGSSCLVLSGMSKDKFSSVGLFHQSWDSTGMPWFEHECPGPRSISLTQTGHPIFYEMEEMFPAG